MSDIEGIDQRPPSEGLGYGRRPEQTRFVNEGAAGKPQRGVRTHPGLLEYRRHLASNFVELGHGVPPWNASLQGVVRLRRWDSGCSPCRRPFLLLLWASSSSISILGSPSLLLQLNCQIARLAGGDG